MHTQKKEPNEKNSTPKKTRTPILTSMDPFYRKHIVMDAGKLEWLINKIGIEDEQTQETSKTRKTLAQAALVAWNSLTPVLQSAVWEYDVEGKGYKEIAANQGVAISTIWKRRQRALKKMRVFIEEKHPEEVNAIIRR